MSTVSANGRVGGDQRYSKGNPCPICSGTESDPRGQGIRCYGFLSSDEAYAHCTQAEQAGSIPISPGSNTYAHKLKGSCKCGAEHGPADPRSSRKVIVAEYDYVAEDGELLFQVVRLEGKQFRQRRPDGKGGWTWKLGDVRRVLYRLPELIESDPGEIVFIVEGEKDVDKLRTLGLVATCNPGGSGKWSNDYAKFFAGRAVCLIPDNDRPGWVHSEVVRNSLLGVAREVKRIDLVRECHELGFGQLPEKGDVSDFLKLGGTAADLKRIYASLEPERNGASPGPTPKQNDSETPDRGGRIDAEPEEEEESEILDPWPIPGPEIFRGIAGEIVRQADPHTEADPVAILIQLLVGFSNAVGRKPYWVAGATKHYLSLFAALVGSTASARKGSSWDVVAYFLRHLDEDWAKKRVTTGLSSGEGLIYHVRDKAIKLDEQGKEVIVDEGVADKRILIIESELGRTIKVMSREGNTLSSILRMAWDCLSPLATMAKNSPNVATEAHVGIVGHITKYELNSLLSKSDTSNGFGNRFLWACVRRSKELPDGGNFFATDWMPIVLRLQEAFNFACGVSEMRRDEEARTIWHEVYGDLTRGRPGLLGAMLGRAEPQVMRLACIYALLDGSAVVGGSHMMAALALWDYVEESARYIFGETLGDPTGEKLLAALKAAPDGLTRKQITVDVFGGNKKKDVIDRMLSDLLGQGLIHHVTRDEGRRGPKPQLWFAGRVFRVHR